MGVVKDQYFSLLIEKINREEQNVTCEVARSALKLILVPTPHRLGSLLVCAPMCCLLSHTYECTSTEFLRLSFGLRWPRQERMSNQAEKSLV